MFLTVSGLLKKLFNGSNDRRAWLLQSVKDFDGSDATLQQIKKLINELSIEELRRENSNILHIAAGKGYTVICALLLDKGVDVNSYCSYDGRTVLQFAAGCCHLETFSFLLERGADVQHRSEPMRSNDDTVLHTLAKAVPMENEKNLSVSASLFASQQLQICQLLLDRNIDIDALNNRRSSALHEACKRGRIELCRLLLDRGSDVNAADSVGRTPLIHAVNSSSNSQFKLCELLLERGAKVNVKDASGCSALFHALNRYQRLRHISISGMPGGPHSTGGIEVIALLLEHKADIEAQNVIGATPLHLAARFGVYAIVSMLLDHGACVLAKDDQRLTPLHVAASYGHPDICRLLLENGADVSSKSAVAVQRSWPEKLVSFKDEHNRGRLVEEMVVDEGERDHGHIEEELGRCLAPILSNSSSKADDNDKQGPENTSICLSSSDSVRVGGGGPIIDIQLEELLLQPLVAPHQSSVLIAGAGERESEYAKQASSKEGQCGSTGEEVTSFYDENQKQEHKVSDEKGSAESSAGNELDAKRGVVGDVGITKCIIGDDGGDNDDDDQLSREDGTTIILNATEEDEEEEEEEVGAVEEQGDHACLLLSVKSEAAIAQSPRLPHRFDSTALDAAQTDPVLSQISSGTTPLHCVCRCGYNGATAKHHGTASITTSTTHPPPSILKDHYHNHHNHVPAHVLNGHHHHHTHHAAQHTATTSSSRTGSSNNGSAFFTTTVKGGGGGAGKGNCYVDVINALLLAGADINAADDYGYTPLHLAAQGNFTEAFDTLLKRGADYEALDWLRRAPTKLGNQTTRGLLTMLVSVQASDTVVSGAVYSPNGRRNSNSHYHSNVHHSVGVTGAVAAASSLGGGRVSPGRGRAFS